MPTRIRIRLRFKIIGRTRLAKRWACVDDVFLLEERRRKGDARSGHLLEEVGLEGLQASGERERQRPSGCGRVPPPEASRRRCPEVTTPTHAEDLGDVRDLAGAVDQTGDLDQQVERARDLPGRIASRGRSTFAVSTSVSRRDSASRESSRGSSSASPRGQCSSPGACPGSRRCGPRRR